MTAFKSFTTKLSRNILKYSTLQFVPKHEPAKSSDINLFKSFLNNYNDILVLTGAGISTESGIPDYRSEEVGLYARSNNRPTQYQEFIKKPHARKRYWARNFVGWPIFSNVQPNQTHLALAKLENEQLKIISIVTQNVDHLHYKAGSQKVIELHGSTYRVKCSNCNYQINRHDFQTVLQTLNPSMKETSGFIRPDGDVELSDEQVQHFQVPDCGKCGGFLKPDIVFFGDNVPRSRVEKVENLVSQCGAVLVLGTSLSVFSSYRIILQAHDLCKYIFIVNIGNTRGDERANVKISTKCSDLFSVMS